MSGSILLQDHTANNIVNCHCGENNVLTASCAAADKFAVYGMKPTAAETAYKALACRWTKIASGGRFRWVVKQPHKFHRNSRSTHVAYLSFISLLHLMPNSFN